MRILFIVHQFLPEFSSGTEQVTYNIAKMMQHAGHRVEVLTCSLDADDSERWVHAPSGLRETVVDGLRVTALPFSLMGPMADLGFSRMAAESDALRDYFAHREFDVCHVTHLMRMTAALDFVRDVGIPYVITLTDFFFLCYRINLIRTDGSFCSGPADGVNCQKHCNVPPMTKNSLQVRYREAAEVLRGATSVIACSDYVARVFRAEMNDIPVRVNPHGIDLLRFPPPAKRQRTDGRLTFGYVGTISEPKGVHVLVEAFRRAAGPHLRLRVVGPTYTNHAYRERLEQLTAGDERISIEGPRPHDEIPEFMLAVDVLCIPSLVPETASLSLYEGFAAGLPALVSDIGNQAAAIRGAQCGTAIAPGDVNAWTKAIESVGEDPSLVESWQQLIPLPVRLEEEAFFYEVLYRHAIESREPLVT